MDFFSKFKEVHLVFVIKQAFMKLIKYQEILRNQNKEEVKPIQLTKYTCKSVYRLLLFYI